MKRTKAPTAQSEKPFSAASKLDAATPTDESAAVTANEPVTAAAHSEEEVANRAFHHFQSHGETDGHDVEHWLRAEAELTAEYEAAGA